MKIKDEVLQVLSAAKVSGNELYLQGQLDRPMYLAVNKVLEASGGLWNRKSKCHIFDKDAEERIDEIILTGEIDVPKDDFNYFPTPPDVVAKLLKLANITEGMNILEPSAGQGAIALACAEIGCIVDCYELMEANIKVLLEHNVMRGGKLRRTLKQDFLTVESILNKHDELKYHRIVANPPFAKQADIKHVTHAHKFLKPDGLLVSVMSAGVLFRSDRRTTEFRDFVESKGGEFEKLPEGSFKASGTMVSTCIVSIPA